MATLEKIRNKSGLLIGIIAFGLFVFIGGDFLKGGSSLFGSQRNVGKVDGTSIELADYQNRVNEMSEIFKTNARSNSLDAATMDQVYSQVWDGIIREQVLFPEFDKLGLAISEDELFDRVQGSNLDPIIQQMFRDQNSGQVNTAQVVNYLKAITEQGGSQLAHWLFYERMIKENRLNAKYNNLISKGLYVSEAEAALVKKGSDTNKAVEFFKLAYSSIADSLVQVSDSEIKAYYNKNVDAYKQEEAREIEYITFPIVASDADYKDGEEWANDVKAELAEVDGLQEVTNYVKLNSDEAWDGARTKKEETGSRFQEFAFGEEVGAVYGPYFESETYKVVKLVSRELRSDSVNASHILIQGEDPAAAVALADSLLAVVKKSPRVFAAVAKEFSKDPGSGANGGSLGWFKEGQMVPEFNDACFDGKKGDIVKVTSQFGIHIIKIDQKGKPVEKVQLATVARKVEPSTDTYRIIYAEASKFIGTNNTVDKFKSGVEADDKITLQTGRNLGKNDKRVNALTDARELVQWAYNNEKGILSDIMEVEDNFVIATISAVKKEGHRAVSEVSDLIKSELVKDKKAAQLIAKIDDAKSGSQTLSSMAQKVGASVASASDVNFNSYQITGAGREPALTGAIAFATKDVVSAPVQGETGVYVFRVTAETAVEDAPTVDAVKTNLASSFQYRVGYQSYDALRSRADIEDTRYKFY